VFVACGFDHGASRPPRAGRGADAPRSRREHVQHPARHHARRRRACARRRADRPLTRPQLSVAGYIRKSLLAAWIGNIVGALLVALPAVYFYLRDDPLTDAAVSAEEGEGMSGLAKPAPASPAHSEMSEHSPRKAE
jgi:hypothetical protein